MKSARKQRIYYVALLLIAVALATCSQQSSPFAPAAPTPVKPEIPVEPTPGAPAEPAVRSYPGTKAIEVIVPWPAGGSTDRVSRVAASLLSANLGATVTVMNEAGGQGVSGTVSALSSAADGYTLLGDADGSNAIPEAWGTDVPYKAGERTYICRIASFPWFFAAAPGTGWKSMNDIAEAIRNTPSDIRFGWLGGTAGADCAPAQFIAAMQAHGIDTSAVHMVAFAGGTDLAAAIASGYVDFGCLSVASVASVFETSTLQLISITSRERFPAYPFVATTKEQGWGTVDFMGHVGFSGPDGMSEEAVQVLADAMAEIMAGAEAEQKFREISAIPDYLGPQDFRAYVLSLADTLTAIKIN
ncbi:MAG: tripartite tricarboxylate transporter substrate binding protein [Clostridiales bacterium]|nr:tripartite tricarboxylate transporter substrate binding protein [Clostridiales bacterium]